ncbi:MAG: acetyltransferase [Chloroflexi bacterium]|nr:MAG: acetyltransferase [Chloroflexota bacterium]
MNTNSYLGRLGVGPAASPGYELLAGLQQAHLLNIPFENLSVIWREPIVLDEQRLVEKVVHGRRGGYCYELNGAFAWLLRHLGYQVTRISARVYNGSTQEFGPEFDHMALMVRLDRDYLVDVGFGDSARQPIPLPAGEVEDVSGRYRVIQRNGVPGGYELQRSGEDGWLAQYAFTTEPRQLAEYAEMCHYHSHSPASHFTQRAVCTIATPTGRITLSPAALTVTERGEKRTHPIAETEYSLLLWEHFGIRAA